MIEEDMDLRVINHAQECKTLKVMS